MLVRAKEKCFASLSLREPGEIFEWTRDYLPPYLEECKEPVAEESEGVSEGETEEQKSSKASKKRKSNKELDI